MHFLITYLDYVNNLNAISFLIKYVLIILKKGIRLHEKHSDCFNHEEKKNSFNRTIQNIMIFYSAILIIYR